MMDYNKPPGATLNLKKRLALCFILRGVQFVKPSIGRLYQLQPSWSLFISFLIQDLRFSLLNLAYLSSSLDYLKPRYHLFPLFYVVFFSVLKYCDVIQLSLAHLCKHFDSFRKAQISCDCLKMAFPNACE